MPIYNHKLSIQDVYKEIGSKKIKLQFLSDEPKTKKKANVTNIGNIRGTNQNIDSDPIEYINNLDSPTYANILPPSGYRRAIRINVNRTPLVNFPV